MSLKTREEVLEYRIHELEVFAMATHDTVLDLQRQIRGNDAKVAALETLVSKVLGDFQHVGVVCLYCKSMLCESTTEEADVECGRRHAEECPKHPMAALKSQLAESQAALVETKRQLAESQAALAVAGKALRPFSLAWENWQERKDFSPHNGVAYSDFRFAYRTLSAINAAREKGAKE